MEAGNVTTILYIYIYIHRERERERENLRERQEHQAPFYGNKPVVILLK